MSNNIKKNKIMHYLKIIGSILIMVGYGGYGGFYTKGNINDFMQLWFGAVILAGIIMIWITSKDYYKDAEYDKKLTVLDLCMVFSAFILPNIIPFSKSISILISHILTCVIIYILNINYWRIRWKNK